MVFFTQQKKKTSMFFILHAIFVTIFPFTTESKFSFEFHLINFPFHSNKYSTRVHFNSNPLFWFSLNVYIYKEFTLYVWSFHHDYYQCIILYVSLVYCIICTIHSYMCVYHNTCLALCYLKALFFLYVLDWICCQIDHFPLKDFEIFLTRFFLDVSSPRD